MSGEENIVVNNSTILDKFTVLVATGLFVLVLGLTTTQVVVRQLPFVEIAWTEPLARFVFIVMTYMGAAVALRNSELLSIDMFVNKLRDLDMRVYKAVVLFNSVVIVSFLLIALAGTVINARANWGTVIGGISGLTSGYIYTGIAIGLFFMVIFAALNVRRIIVGDT